MSCLGGGTPLALQQKKQFIYQPTDLHPPVALNPPQAVAPTVARGQTAAWGIWTGQKETSFTTRAAQSWDRHPDSDESLSLEVSSSARESGGWLPLLL